MERKCRTREELDEISEKIIGCAFAVANTLGHGFLEKVYENALAIELGEAGLSVEQQVRSTVTYKEKLVGDYIADLIVEGDIIVEVKATRNLGPAHKAQCMNYLSATGLRVCLLVNFCSPKVMVKRVVSGF